MLYPKVCQAYSEIPWKIAKQKNKIVLPDWVKHQSDEITRTIFNEINTFKLKEVA